MGKIVITPIAGALGAEIGGVDLGQPLETDIVAEIRQALLDHLVIFFRDQAMTSDHYMAFAKAFGTPIEYPLVKGVDGYPLITEIVEARGSRQVNFGGVLAFGTPPISNTPPMGSMLSRARGATLWRRHDVRQPVSRL